MFPKQYHFDMDDLEVLANELLHRIVEFRQSRQLPDREIDAAHVD
jgi:hypothetical protein